MAEPAAALTHAGMQVTKGVYLLRRLGAGGMGEVWLADHQGLKTHVVVKFMLDALDSNDSGRSRFSREAAAAARVKSPHVVQMFDHGVTEAGLPFIVMEHLEGHDLNAEIKEVGPIEPAKVSLIITQVARALSKVHAAGLLHRDIKPANIFLCDGDGEVFVKLLDFGIVKKSTVDQETSSLDGETKTGQIVGTPFYMSPEQVTAQKEIDHRSDLWALGVVAYEALTGAKPYDGPSFGALAVRIATGAPPKPSAANPALPPSADEWFERACARNPSDRFSTAKEMADALRQALEGVGSQPPRISNGDARATAGATAVGLATTVLEGPTRSRPFLKIAVPIALTLTAVGVLVRFVTTGTPPSGAAAVPSSSPSTSDSAPSPAPTLAETPSVPDSAAPPAPHATAVPVASATAASARPPSPSAATPTCASHETLSKGHCCARGLEWRDGRCERPLATKF